jgi:CBS domain-containing protein
MLTVDEVMTPQVVTINDDQTIKNAARVMANHGISSLIVFSPDGLKGILTEKDIVTRVVCASLDPEEVCVSEVMSEPVIVVTPDTPLEKAVEIMLQHRIKKLPVMEKTDDALHLVGIVSLIDIAALHPELINSLKEMVHMETESIAPAFYVC